MKKTLINLFLGTGLGIGGLTVYNKINPNKNINKIQQSVINNYINEHNLKILHKMTLMKAYMMYNKAFLDYGIIQKLQGFAFFQVYFNQNEVDTQNITQIYCIFSPKDQVCGHPSIQHGGVSATILDQITGVLAMINTNGMAATSELSVKYLKPIRKGQVYLLKAKVDHKQGRKVYLNGTIQDIQTKTKVLQGSTLMVSVNWQHQMSDVFKILFPSKKQQAKV